MSRIQDDGDRLETTRRHISDAIDTLDTLDSQSTHTVIALALLTGARVVLGARLEDERKEEG